MMIRTNREKLIMKGVLGEIDSPTLKQAVYKVSPEGEPLVLPSVGGITYNLRLGDPALGWQADHAEPGVCIRNPDKGEQYNANVALNVLSCIGNTVRVVTGEAKGEQGVVTGKHGGIEHILVDFHPDVLERLVIGDKVMIRAFGVGLRLVDCPGVRAMNIDPDLVERLPLRQQDDVLRVPVTHRIPAMMMGSGLGSSHAHSGDYDVQLNDETAVREAGLETLRLGDMVALLDTDHSFGRVYKKGTVSVGVVVHADCIASGHGPGVTTIFTSSSGKIATDIDPEANLARYLTGQTA